MKEIILFDRVGAFAENKDIARDMRINEILPALSHGEDVVLNFDRVGAATQSFVHALISEPIRQFGPDVFQRLLFKSCHADVKKIVAIVADYLQA